MFVSKHLLGLLLALTQTSSYETDGTTDNPLQSHGDILHTVNVDTNVDPDEIIQPYPHNAANEPVAALYQSLTNHRGPTPRIVGGQPVQPHDRYPFQAAIYRVYSSGYKQLICGGSLITDRHILSAAHCTSGSAVVQIGRWNTDGFNSGEVKGVDYEERTIVKKEMHPDYSSTTLNADFVVFELDAPITISRWAPVELNQDPNFPDESGVTLNVMGWGTIEENGPVSTLLLETTVDYKSNEFCNAKYGFGSITDKMLCAASPGQDACQGDSGGPLIYRSNTTSDDDLLVGVVSWGNGCASERYPGVYARISTEYDWIRETVCGGTAVGPICDGPTRLPTLTPTHIPTADFPTKNPTPTPTLTPTGEPTQDFPTENPSLNPTTRDPTTGTVSPTRSPSVSPTEYDPPSMDDWPTNTGGDDEFAPTYWGNDDIYTPTYMEFDDVYTPTSPNVPGGDDEFAPTYLGSDDENLPPYSGGDDEFSPTPTDDNFDDDTDDLDDDDNDDFGDDDMPTDDNFDDDTDDFDDDDNDDFGDDDMPTDDAFDDDTNDFDDDDMPTDDAFDDDTDDFDDDDNDDFGNDDMPIDDAFDDDTDDLDDDDNDDFGDDTMPTDDAFDDDTDDLDDDETGAPLSEPTNVPSPEPTNVPSPEPTNVPSPEPTNVPSPEPTNVPSPEPTNVPSPEPTNLPTPPEPIRKTTPHQPLRTTFSDGKTSYGNLFDIRTEWTPLEITGLTIHAYHWMRQKNTAKVYACVGASYEVCNQNGFETEDANGGGGGEGNRKRVRRLADAEDESKGYLRRHTQGEKEKGEPVKQVLTDEQVCERKTVGGCEACVTTLLPKTLSFCHWYNENTEGPICAARAQDGMGEGRDVCVDIAHLGLPSGASERSFGFLSSLNQNQYKQSDKDDYSYSIANDDYPKWTLLQSLSSIPDRGYGIPTPLADFTTPLSLPPQTICGLYVTLTKPHIRYSDGTSSDIEYAKDDHLVIETGVGIGNYPLKTGNQDNFFYSPRVWNGEIRYSTVDESAMSRMKVEEEEDAADDDDDDDDDYITDDARHRVTRSE